MDKCKKCAKEMTCNKEKCKPVKWIETKNYGEVKHIQQVDTEKE